MLCIRCNKEKSESEFIPSHLKYHIYRCRDCERKRDYDRRRSANTHKACIEFLGGKCARCGLDDERVLQIDHINGGGKKEIQSFAKHYFNWRAYYRHVLADTTGKYQILCANCNWIKRHEKKEGVR